MFSRQFSIKRTNSRGHTTIIEGHNLFGPKSSFHPPKKTPPLNRNERKCNFLLKFRKANEICTSVDFYFKKEFKTAYNRKKSYVVRGCEVNIVETKSLHMKHISSSHAPSTRGASSVAMTVSDEESFRVNRNKCNIYHQLITLNETNFPDVRCCRIQ